VPRLPRPHGQHALTDPVTGAPHDHVGRELHSELRCVGACSIPNGGDIAGWHAEGMHGAFGHELSPCCAATTLQSAAALHVARACHAVLVWARCSAHKECGGALQPGVA
jgi:hypothetical protein